MVNLLTAGKIVDVWGCSLSLLRPFYFCSAADYFHELYIRQEEVFSGKYATIWEVILAVSMLIALWITASWYIKNLQSVLKYVHNSTYQDIWSNYLGGHMGRISFSGTRPLCWIQVLFTQIATVVMLPACMVSGAILLSKIRKVFVPLKAAFLDRSLLFFVPD